MQIRLKASIHILLLAHDKQLLNTIKSRLLIIIK